MTETLKKNPHEIVDVPTDDILVDEERRPRAKAYEMTIYEYAEALEKGITLPPIDIYHDGKLYFLADGYHRLEAYKLAKFDLIPAIVHQGGRREALIHALGSNTTHGLRRSNADKEKAVTIALKDHDIGRTSNNQIAKICGTSQPYVGNIRKELTCNGYKFGTTRVCSDGRIMDVSDIGAKGEPVSAPVQPETSVVEDNNNEVGGPSDQEDLDNAGDQNTDPEDSNPGEETKDDVDTPPETELENGDQDLDIDLEDNLEAGDTDESEITEDDPDPVVDEDDLKDVVDTDTEGDDNTDAEAQALNLDESEGDEDNNLDADETTEPGACEDEFETNPEHEENVAADPEGEETQDDGDTPPETEHGDDDQELDLDESENDEDVLDTDDTTDTETTEDDLELEDESEIDLEHDEDPDTDDSVDTNDDEDDTDIDETDESTDSEIEIEDPEETTGDDNPDTSDLDGIDPDALKLRVVHLEDTTKKQKEEIEAKNSYIAELENLVKELEKYSLYLEEQLEAHADAGTEATASLDINEMDEEYDYSMA